MRNELAELLSFSQLGATVYIGYIIALFAYEMYKEEGKETIQLLRDLLFFPYTVTEQVIHRIKSDKDCRLLKNSLFDLSNEFANCLR